MVVPFIREELFVIVAVLFCKYIGVVVSNTMESPTEKTGT